MRTLAQNANRLPRVSHMFQTALMACVRRAAIPFAFSVLCLAPLTPAVAGVTAYKQAVAESMAEDAEIAAFYRERGFDPFWTGESGDHLARRQALFAVLAQADMHGLPARRYDAEGLMAQMAAVRHARDLGIVEVALTRTYLTFAHDLQSGLLIPSRVDSGIKRENPRRTAADLMALAETGQATRIVKALQPQSHDYARLLKEKLRLERLTSSGGWGPAVPNARYEMGDSGPGVVALRNRLIAMGYLPRTLSASYDLDMQAAVKRFQDDHGLTADGIAAAATLEEINKAPQDRMKSVLVAMERERWTNFAQGRGDRHILVNLTDFKARIIDHGKVTFETRSVIGHQDLDRRTPEFSDEMDHMVINPSWFVPRSIIVKEYLPKLQANSGAVSHLQVVDRRGQVVGRGRDFSQYSARSFPYSMRQPPGPSNALGSVKFMFPNKYNIYLHDTPAKNLFDREVRTYSHGCVRLNDPHEFGYALLAAQTDDPVGFFQSRLRSGRETRVNLDQPVPVHLIYRTAFTTAKGKTQYRRDMYGRDAKVWQALEAQGVVLTRAEG